MVYISNGIRFVVANAVTNPMYKFSNLNGVISSPKKSEKNLNIYSNIIYLTLSTSCPITLIVGHVIMED